METAILTENLPARTRVSPFPQDNGDRNNLLNLMRKLKPKHRLIADLACRGWTAQRIAKELGVHHKTVVEVLKRQEVIEYVSVTVTNLFQDCDRMLLNVFMKAILILDQQLDSTDAGVRDRAVDKTLKFFQATKGADGRAKPLIAQFFSNTGKDEQKVEEEEESLDDTILRKRRERGLPND
jgi:hypothetical protein